MKNNQDIGAAVKHKLEDLHNSPDDFIWDVIEEKLKKKRRRLLFWYFTFGLGLVLLGLFILNPFNSFITDDIFDYKSKEQSIEIVEKDDDTSTSSNANFKNQKYNQKPVSNVNTQNKSSNDNVSSKQNALVTHKESALNTKQSKSSIRNSITSEKEKPSNSGSNEQESNTTSTSNNLRNTSTQNSSITSKNDLKSPNRISLAEATKSTAENLKEKAIDTLLKTEIVVLEISEAIKEKKLDKKENVKDSITERAIRWSINPQLIQSNYGAFNAETNNISSTNHGLLLGVRMTKTTFLRFGVRKLDLVQTVNNLTNSVSYLELPLEVKYFFRDKKFNPYFNGGLSYFILQDSNSENPINLEYGDNFSLNFGLGIEHKLYDRFYINLESNFNYQIKPITSNIDYTPYILSISTGIDYRF